MARRSAFIALLCGDLGLAMKLAFTIADAGHALHVGGQVTQTTHIIDVPENLVPMSVKQYLDNKHRPECYWSMSISVVEEPST